MPFPGMSRAIPRYMEFHLRVSVACLRHVSVLDSALLDLFHAGFRLAEASRHLLVGCSVRLFLEFPTWRDVYPHCNPPARFDLPFSVPNCSFSSCLVARSQPSQFRLSASLPRLPHFVLSHPMLS